MVFAEQEPTENNPRGEGCYLSLSGEGCRQLEMILKGQGRTWQKFFNACYQVGEATDYHTTRLDIAIDDRNSKPYFTIEQLIGKVKREEYLSDSRGFHVHESSYGDGVSKTLYIGKSKSEVMYRFYEKGKEQASKKGLPLDHYGNWIRSEIQTRKETADILTVQMAFFQADFNEFAFDFLNEKLRFLIPDESQKKKSRWKTWRPWERFLGETKPFQLEKKQEIQALANTHRWIVENGIAPAVKLFQILEEQDALGYLDKLSGVVERAKISDQLMAKVTAHLTEIDRLDILPLIEQEARSGAYTDKGA